MKAACALIVAAALSCVASAASVDAAPRLWRVSGADDSGEPIFFYLLGVTHNGLPVEYDAYFRDRVIPAFESAKHYSYENANLTGEKIGPCAQPLVSEHGRAAVEALRVRLTDVETRFYEAVDRRIPQSLGPRANPWRKLSEASAKDMSEFEMILALPGYRSGLSSLEGRTRRHPSAASRQPIAQALASKRPEIVAASLDAPQDLVDAYCDSGEGRIAFIETSLQQDDLFDEPAKASQKQIEAELDQGGRDFIATFAQRRPVGVFDSGRQFSESILCERNAKWLGKMTHPDATGPWFYAVGLAHLFPVAGPTASCDGLIADLERMGWSVSAVTAKT